MYFILLFFGFHDKISLKEKRSVYEKNSCIMMGKVFVFLADGFEEIEALTPVDVLRRANVHVDLVGMDDLKVTSSHQITIQMDCVFNDQIKEYDGIVIPGGLPGATNLRDDARVIEIVQQFNREHKLIAAICAGPIVLAKAGILKDKICTCSPGFETQLTGANYQEAIVQKDDYIITGKGPAAALEFGYTILESLGYDSSNLRQGMQYEYLMNVEAHKE